LEILRLFSLNLFCHEFYQQIAIYDGRNFDDMGLVERLVLLKEQVLILTFHDGDFDNKLE